MLSKSIRTEKSNHDHLPSINLLPWRVAPQSSGQTRNPIIILDLHLVLHRIYILPLKYHGLWCFSDTLLSIVFSSFVSNFQKPLKWINLWKCFYIPRWLWPLELCSLISSVNSKDFFFSYSLDKVNFHNYRLK